MEVALALASAALFALGSVLQQRAGDQAPTLGAGGGLLLRMARRPVWLAGIAADALGFVAQAAALGAGRLAVVQPLLVASVVFALPLGAWLGDQRVSRADVAAALLVTAALAAFITISAPGGGRDDAPVSAWVIAGAACLATCAPLVLLARRATGARRAALLGSAAGILFALSAALTKAVVDELSAGLLHVLGGWELYALIAVGYVSMTLNQLSLDARALAATMATSTALDPIASVVLGLTLFQETLHASNGEVLGTVASLAAALAGMVILARSEPPARKAASP